MPDEAPRGEMPFLDHLEELRWRILKSLIAVTLGTAIGWLLVQQIDVIEVLKRPIAPYIPSGRLAFTSPTEPFLLTLKIAFAVGLLLASPVVIYQIWAFLAPALYTREKRVIIPALSVGAALFAAGAAAAYFYALPAALGVLFTFQRDDLAAIITIDKYFGFALPFILAFGLVTELPLVVVILASLGLVTPQFLARNRRYAIVVAAFVAALLTPPDALSMLMMMVPLVLLYEISIVCAWVVVRRKARRRAAAASSAAVVALLVLSGTTALHAQNPPPQPIDSQKVLRRRPPPPRPGAAQPPGTPGPKGAGQALDSAAARQLGLPSGPTRAFPEPDAVIDSLLTLHGYEATRYVADTLLVEGDSGTIFLRGAAFVDREGTKLEADSVKYREAVCRLDAAGDPRLFDQGTVLVGEGMRYDTCLKRGTVNDALTDFEQGGATWLMRGDLAVDSGATRLYGASSKVTSDTRPEPDYHFAAGEVKWLNKNVMVARPAVLYVRDVPILWLPFIFQDIRSGRRSGMLVPRFGVNDLVRPSRSYQRHVANVGYYFAINDYVDFLASADWFAGRNFTVRAQTRYRWLDRFITGGISYTRLAQTDASATSTRIGWTHQQRFDSRTSFNASVDYATSARVVQRNSIDPFLAVANLNSRVNFDKRFAWGALSVGGSRSQNLSSDLVNQTFPEVRLTPAAVNITPTITWSPGFSYTNTQTFHNPGGTILIPGDSVPDTLATFFDARRTAIGFQTPLRLGRWNWTNSVDVQDVASNQRQEFVIPDSTAPGGSRRVLYGRTFVTRVDWQTGINLPSLFSGSWKLQPGISILNTTSAGPFMIRNQFSGGKYVRQGKRLAFRASISPAFFGFFPGAGPLARIRHAVSPLVSYEYAPGAKVPEEYAHVLDPTGQTLNARSDPRQLISVGLSQNIEGKLRRPAGDTTDQPARKLRILSINTSAVGYNFEQAKQPGRTGWQTQSITNTLASDLVPGFSLTLGHNLWQGPVGFDTTKFNPFLENVAASFSITPATLAGVASLFGLGSGRAPTPAPTPAAPDQAPEVPPAAGPGPRQGMDPRFSGYAGPGGVGVSRRGFSLSLSYSSTRQREQAQPVSGSPPPGAGQGGRQQLNMTLSFSPTAKWTANWTTAYDLDTRRFGQHYVRFERDLYRWHASFALVKSPNGNFAFNFYISLLDQPDIKFDYDQQTFANP
ncbi:MAG: twin-arginine translocase subunit TatC [Gemmatimonadetes bacterium]|nr:twin-arginine translocase subunit TatC [Gemmatimonadota bacterium]